MTTQIGSNSLGLKIDTNVVQINIDSNVSIDINKQNREITLTNMKVTGLQTPVNSSDAVTKDYVDSTPFIQLYSTQLPLKGNSFNTEWSSVQSNQIQKNNSNITLPIGLPHQINNKSQEFALLIVLLTQLRNRSTNTFIMKKISLLSTKLLNRSNSNHNPFTLQFTIYKI